MRHDSSTHRRSLLKGLSWEAISTTVTFALAWLVFGRALECAVFVAVCFAIKSVLFYLHERVWHQVSYGKRYDATITEEEGQAPAN